MLSELDIEQTKESMSSPGDWRDEGSTDEEIKPPRLKTRTAQVTCLPFSVEALMSDRRPLNVTERKEASVTDYQSHRADEFTKQFVSIKSESSERVDCASWIPSPIKISTPPRK